MEQDNEKSYNCGICDHTLPTKNQLILHVAAHRKLENQTPSTSGTKPKETPRRSTRVKNTRSEAVMTTRYVPDVKKTVAKTNRKDRKSPSVEVVDITGDGENNVKTAMSEEKLLKAIDDVKMKMQEDLTHKLTELQKEIIASITKNVQGELQKRWRDEENRESRRQEIRDLLTHFREKEKKKMENAEPNSGTSLGMVGGAEETIVITYRQPRDGTHERNTDLSAIEKIEQPDGEPEAGPQDPRARQVEGNRDDESVKEPESNEQAEESGEEESSGDESSVEISNIRFIPQHVIGASSTDEEE
jgi:hypothetical protein